MNGGWSRTRVKICGCTGPRDAALAVAAGADAVGMIFAPSPRRITLAAAAETARELPPFVAPVGVFVNPSIADIEAVRALFPHLVVQLHGEETAAFAAGIGPNVIKALHVGGTADAAALERAAQLYPRGTLLFDTSVDGVRGGSGTPFAWSAVAGLARSRILVVAGGLNPENVGACVRTVRPFGVDVRSGVETDGSKDEKKIRAFVGAVRDADAA